MNLRCSALGDLHPLFAPDAQKRKGIKDDLKAGLEMYPVGYSRYQVEHRVLWDLARNKGTEDDLYPLGHDAKVILVEQNTYLRIYFHTMEARLLLGVVPNEITRVLCRNMKLLKDGKVLKVRENHHGKHYIAKVIFPYKIVLTDSASRFKDLELE